MIGIVNYDAGNTRSVQNTLERIGVAYILSDKKEELNVCTKIILPGVGSAGAAMHALQEKQLVRWIQDCKKPFLGICLGMQLLFEASEEGSITCLGIIPDKVKKFKATKKIPHIGWNMVTKKDDDGEDKGNFYYFLHSYLASVGNYTIGTCQYEEEVFSAIVRKDNFLGMQFHPEKSGDSGQKLLAKFIDHE